MAGNTDAMVIPIVHVSVLVGAFAIFWFLALFCLLPVGLGRSRSRNRRAAQPMLLPKAGIATGIAAVLWVVFYALIAFGVFDLCQHDLRHERQRDDRHRRVHVAPAAGDDLDRGIGDEADAHAGGDGIGERDRQRRDQRGCGFGHVVPVDVLQALCHQRGDEDQRRRGGIGGHRARQRREEQAQQEQHCHDHRRQPGAAARLHAGGAFDISGDRRGAERGADHRADGVARQCAACVSVDGRSSSSFAWCATAVSVPEVSSMSISRNTSTPVTMAARPMRRRNAIAGRWARWRAAGR